ncbi:MAG: hypothetical protein II128_02545 [Atopobiaceae bacterium]|nr:hypothetical protein [Atopobiaceae bacterium]
MTRRKAVPIMSPHAKLLKITGIVSLLAGVALVITAFAMMVVTHFALESMLLLAAGGFCLFLGREAAVAANVPSTASGLILSSGSAVFWCVCLSVGGWFAAGRQFNLCVCLIPISVVLTLVLTLVIVRVAKIEEQV